MVKIEKQELKIDQMGAFSKWFVLRATNIHGQTPIHIAVLKDLTRCLSELGDHEVDLNVRNQDGQSALHLAASNGKEDFIRFLIDHKADVNAQDCAKRTPLHCAVEARCQFYQTMFNSTNLTNLDGIRKEIAYFH